MSAGEIVFRPIAAKDNQALAAVIRAGMKAFGLDGPGSGFNDPAMDDLYATYSSLGSAYLVACQDGKILGGGGIAPLTAGNGSTCELQRMYLTTAARGKGTGRILLAKNLELARRLGYRHCYLETHGDMVVAQHLYRAAGFILQPQRVGSTGHCACNTFYLKDLKEEPQDPLLENP